jgi:hypothetical protein
MINTDKARNNTDSRLMHMLRVCTNKQMPYGMVRVAQANGPRDLHTSENIAPLWGWTGNGTVMGFFTTTDAYSNFCGYEQIVQKYRLKELVKQELRYYDDQGRLIARHLMKNPFGITSSPVGSGYEAGFLYRPDNVAFFWGKKVKVMGPDKRRPIAPYELRNIIGVGREVNH